MRTINQVHANIRRQLVDAQHRFAVENRSRAAEDFLETISYHAAGQIADLLENLYLEDGFVVHGPSLSEWPAADVAPSIRALIH